MSEEHLIEIAKQLIAIPSTADNLPALHEACDVMVQLINAAGKDITIEQFESNGKPSLLAYRGGSRPERFHVLCNAHLDVVPGKPEQYQPYVRDGKLYGRGAYDMKTAAIVLAEVFCEFVDKVPYALGLQFVTDEESSGVDGTQHQIAEGVRGDFVICGECGRLPGAFEIANETKGVVLATLEFTGSSSHGAYPWNGTNAALKAARFATTLHERFPTPSEATGDTTVTLTSIVTTNDAHNKVPEHAVATIDARYAAGDPNFQTKAHFETLLRQIDPDVTVTGYNGFSAPMYTNPSNPLLLALKAAAEQTEGHAFEFTKRNGASDGRYYSEVGGEACEFGIPGENQHGDDEYVPLQAITNYRRAMRTFLATSIELERSRFERPVR